MHATTPSRKRADASAKQTASANRPARSSAIKASGVLQFPDAKATVAEVANWIKTGELPERCKC